MTMLAQIPTCLKHQKYSSGAEDNDVWIVGGIMEKMVTLLSVLWRPFQQLYSCQMLQMLVAEFMYVIEASCSSKCYQQKLEAEVSASSTIWMISIIKKSKNCKLANSF